MFGPFIQVSRAPERNPVGRRIRFLEPPRTTAWWRYNAAPGTWFPTYGMLGTIIRAAPLPPMLGEGPLVRWDGGQVKALGSVSLYEFID